MIMQLSTIIVNAKYNMKTHSILFGFIRQENLYDET